MCQCASRPAVQAKAGKCPSGLATATREGGEERGELRHKQANGCGCARIRAGKGVWWVAGELARLLDLISFQGMQTRHADQARVQGSAPGLLQSPGCLHFGLWRRLSYTSRHLAARPLPLSLPSPSVQPKQENGKWQREIDKQRTLCGYQVMNTSTALACDAFHL